jgi:hypothetical protein
MLLAALSVCATVALAQVNMEWIRQQWRAHNYRDVIAPLKDYLDSLGDDARAFEADYMMATSLASLPDHHSEGCRYFLAMVSLYNRKQQFSVAGSLVTIQSAMQEKCPSELASLNPPPPPPGVSVSPITMVVKRSEVLKRVRTPAPKPEAHYRIDRKYDGKYSSALKQVMVPAPETYYRIQLKHGGQYLDANHCSSTINLNPGSDWENGACQLWRFVSTGDGYYRIQLKHGGQYLDANHCTSTINLNPGSNWENGACQLWRFVSTGDGYYRIQLKHGGQYLDANHCSSTVNLNPGSDWENGACQLWRLVPAGGAKID